MKYKVKVEENRFVVTNSKEEVISIWGSKQIEDIGGLEKCIEKFKKLNPKAEVEIVGSVPAEPTPIQPEPVVTADPPTAAGN